ncbi:MAG TPA: GGDEF domain-containing protein [Alphaproteobacteria bacterium]|jgi:diguanylate cyclase (GGDEF)-like protein|nr:GGDEF domain-containing protein [Alphaproteobacteria bacterium]
MKSKNRAADAKRRRDDNLLIARMGEVAGRLHRSCVKDPKDPPLVERALQAAAEVEQRLVAQSHRIAYLEALSVTDELTGLLNRRGFEEAFRRSLVASGRYGDEGVLIVCDLDDFKTVNDRYGHFAGDAVLRQAGQLLRTQIRDTDFVARLGGDEFAVILVPTGWRNGLKRAQTLSRALNRLVVTLDEQRITVNASIGVERFGRNDTDTDTLLARADMAMYCNKRRRTSIGLVRAAE